MKTEQTELFEVTEHNGPESQVRLKKQEPEEEISYPLDEDSSVNTVYKKGDLVIAYLVTKNGFRVGADDGTELSFVPWKCKTAKEELKAAKEIYEIVNSEDCEE